MMLTAFPTPQAGLREENIGEVKCRHELSIFARFAQRGRSPSASSSGEHLRWFCGTWDSPKRVDHRLAQLVLEEARNGRPCPCSATSLSLLCFLLTACMLASASAAGVLPVSAVEEPTENKAVYG